MKKLKLGILLAFLLSGYLFSQPVYISGEGSPAGDGTIQNPYRNYEDIQNANSFDILLFEKGYSYDPFSIGSGSHEKIGAYGEGEKPLISGFISIPPTAFEAYNGGSIYRVAVDRDIVDLVIGNKYQIQARQPNATDELPYYRCAMVSGPTIPHGSLRGFTLTDALGGGVTIRGTDYTWEDKQVTDTNEGNFTIDGTVDAGFQDSTTFYFNNRLEYLDAPNEWYYGNGYLYVYGLPQTEVLAVVEEYGIKADWNLSNITIEGLTIEGVSNTAIWAHGSGSNVTIQDCRIAFVGKGVQLGGDNHKVLGTSFQNVRHIGIQAYAVSGAVYKDNDFIDIGTYPQFGRGVGNFSAIYHDRGTNNLIHGNYIKRVGYNGIMLYGDNSTISHNQVDSSMLITADGAGIYTWGNYSYNQTWFGNIVTNSLGYDVMRGDVAGINALYVDNDANNILIRDNFVLNSNGAGIWINALAYQNTMMGNLVIDTKGYAIGLWEWGGNIMHGNRVEENIFYRSKPTGQDQPLVGMFSHVNRQYLLGYYDKNFYVNAFDDSVAYISNSTWDYVFKDFTFAEWRERQPEQNQNSYDLDLTGLQHYINLSSMPERVAYTDLLGNEKVDTLQPYQFVLYQLMDSVPPDTIPDDTIPDDTIPPCEPDTVILTDTLVVVVVEKDTIVETEIVIVTETDTLRDTVEVFIPTTDPFDHIADPQDPYLNIYPNPTLGKITMRWYNLPNSAIESIELLNEGKELLNTRGIPLFFNKRGWRIKEPAGKYFIRLKLKNGGEVLEPFIKG